MGMGKQSKLKRIGENLKIYREASGRAIAVVANTLGVDVAFMRSVEKGRKELDFVQYVGIAELYNIGFSSIFEYDNGKYFYCPKIPRCIVELIVQKAEEYCKEKKILKSQLHTILGTNQAAFSHFKHGYCNPTAQRMENMIALFGLSYSVLKQAISAEDKVVIPIKEPEVNILNDEKIVVKPNEPNMDAMNLVTDALGYYKEREKHIAMLKKIIADAQQLLEEIGGASL